MSGDCRLDDRANVYFGHTLETERQDSSYRGRFGNTVLGARTKLSDQVSIYDEARNARGAGPESLTNAFGVDLAPNDRWTYGLTMEIGTVSDPLAGDLERRAGGVGLAATWCRSIRFTTCCRNCRSARNTRNASVSCATLERAATGTRAARI